MVRSDRRPGNRRVAAVQGVEKHGDRGRVPVVDVNHIGPPAHVPGCLQGRPRQQREAQVVVREAVAVVAVDAAARKVRVVPDEKGPGLRSRRLALQHRDGYPAQDAQGDFEGCHGPQIERFAVDGSVAGQDDPHVVTGSGKRPRQRAYRIPQPSALAKGAISAATMRILDIQPSSLSACPSSPHGSTRGSNHDHVFSLSAQQPGKEGQVFAELAGQRKFSRTNSLALFPISCICSW